MKLLDGIVTSRGVFRTIAAVLVAISQLPIPAIAANNELLIEIAAVLGGLGVVKAGAAKGWIAMKEKGKKGGKGGKGC